VYIVRQLIFVEQSVFGILSGSIFLRGFLYSSIIVHVILLCGIVVRGSTVLNMIFLAGFITTICRYTMTLRLPALFATPV
jgi:hypothetical protein